ncbi:MAG: hypothetical protein ACYDBS_08405, partial [Acidimicrobiales bacterium]
MPDTIEVAALSDGEADELFDAYAQVVEALEGFPHAPPLSRAEFEDYWLAHTSAVMVARISGAFAGAYYLRANFVGRA